jgi:orotate phosphoribosyltransferase
VNLAQALEVRPRALQHLIGVRVVVVDDVVTTGATAAEAGRALTARGIRVWGTAAVAGTVPPSAAAGANDERRDDVGPVVPGARHH